MRFCIPPPQSGLLSLQSRPGPWPLLAIWVNKQLLAERKRNEVKSTGARRTENSVIIRTSKPQEDLNFAGGYHSQAGTLSSFCSLRAVETPLCLPLFTTNHSLSAKLKLGSGGKRKQIKDTIEQ